MKLHHQKKIDWFAGGFLLIFLRPFVRFFGIILRRNHKIPEKIHSISMIKMLGGGSLVIALPALLGIRQKHPNTRINLITTRAIKPFAELLGVFDQIDTIDDHNIFLLLITSFKALQNNFRSCVFLDLEAYSRLSTVFAALTCSLNRIGFYLESAHWRQPFHTHLIFFNRSGGVFYFYEQMAKLLHASPASHLECKEYFLKKLQAKQALKKSITVGSGCSGLAKERALKPDEWVKVFESKLSKNAEYKNMEFIFLGASADFEPTSEIISAVSSKFPKLNLSNQCGKMPLTTSVQEILSSQEFWGIDSSLLHFSRLIGTPSTSYWGPTSPTTLLKPYPITEEVHYQPTVCSPCVHVAEFPPCFGNNLCIKNLFENNKHAQDFIPTISTAEVQLPH